MRYILKLIIACTLISSCGAVNTLQYMNFLKKGSAQKDAFSGEVVFSFSNSKVFVPIFINGNRYNFMLDTGAPPSIVSEDLAKDLALKPKGKGKVGDSQGNADSRSLVQIDSLKIGEAVFYNTPAIVTDMRAISAALCIKVDGIIGNSLMRNAVWAFDFNKNILQVSTNRTNLPQLSEPKRLAFTTYKSDYTPVINMNIDGENFDGYLSFDLGADGGIQLGRFIIKEQKAKEQFAYITYTIGTNSIGLLGTGKTDTTFYSLKQDVSIGNVSLNKQLVTYKKSGPTVIGMEIIKNYNLIIDWPGKEIVLSEIKKPSTGAINALGFNYSCVNGQCKVNTITKNSNAEKMGLALGDIIISANGYSFAALGAEGNCELRKKGPFNSDTIELVINKTGKEIKLSFEKDKYNF